MSDAPMRATPGRVRRWLGPALVLGVAVAGCTGRANATGEADPSDPLAVRLERFPCRGRCPVYAVQVTTSGGVRYDGQRFVADTGVRRRRVAPAAVERLLAMVGRTRFATTDSVIVPGQMRCGTYRADLPVTTVSARVQEQWHTVRFDRGCEGAPRFLDSLALAIDSVAGTATWVAPTGGGR